MTYALDMVLHAPARLQIAAVLGRVTDMEFAVLRDVVGVSDSVLSKHLAALAEAGYVALRKAAQDGRQRHAHQRCQCCGTASQALARSHLL